MISKSASSICLVLALAVVGQVTCNTRVDITLSARELPNMDVFDGPPDPYTIVHYTMTPSNPYLKIGQTRYFDNVREVEWPEVFTFDYVSVGSQQRIKLDVMDYDWDEDDYIGYVEFYLRDLVNSFGNTLDLPIIGVKNQGRITIKGRINSTTTEKDGVAVHVESKDKFAKTSVPLVHQLKNVDIPLLEAKA